MATPVLAGRAPISKRRRKTFFVTSVVVALLGALFWLAFFDARPAHADTFTVNSTADPGTGGCDTTECTLREAITAANAAKGKDTINFNIPFDDPGFSSTTGVSTISPTSGGMPQITDPLAIDGYSQQWAQPYNPATGTDAVLNIELSRPSSAPPDAIGLWIRAAKSTVKGLVINRWSEGIRISSSGAKGNNKMEGNYIGTDASGTQPLGNQAGVAIAGAPNDTIGGTKAPMRNIISGNLQGGVAISGAGAMATASSPTPSSPTATRWVIWA